MIGRNLCIKGFKLFNIIDFYRENLKLDIFEKIQDKSLKRSPFQGSKGLPNIGFEKGGIKSIDELYSGLASNHTFDVSSFDQEFGLVSENIYLEDNYFIEKLIDRYGAVNFIRLLLRDLALKDLQIIENQKQSKNSEIVLKKMLLNAGISYLDIEKRLYESFEKTRGFLFMNNGDHMVSDTYYMKSCNERLESLLLNDDASKRKKTRLPVYNKVSSYLFKTMGTGKLRKNIDMYDQRKSEHIFQDGHDKDAFNIIKRSNNYPSLTHKFYFKGLPNSEKVHINSKAQSYSSSFNKIITRMALFDSFGSFESFLKMPGFGSYFKEKTRFPRYPHTTHFKSISMAACCVLLYQNSSRSFLCKKKMSSMVVEFAWRLVFPLVLDYHQHLIQDYISKSKLKITGLNLSTLLSKCFKELNIDHTDSKTFSVDSLYEKIIKLKSKTGYFSKGFSNKLTFDTSSHGQNISQSDQSDTHSSSVIRETATPTFTTASRSCLFSDSVPRPLEMDTIVPPERQPPTLLPSWNEYYRLDEKPLADRFGFIYNFSSKIKNLNSKSAQPIEANNKSNCNHSESLDYLEHIDFSKNKRNDEFKSSDISLKNDSLITSTSSLHKIMNMENTPLNNNAISSATSTTLNNDNSIAQGFITLDLDKKSKSFEAKFLLRSQLDIYGDSKTKQELWDSFLRKVQNEKRRNINPNFHGYEGSELIGISELGIAGKVGKQRLKEFRNLVIGGIPIIYRPKIWGECSGAYQLHQPGYYNDLLTLGKDIDPIVVVQIDMDVYRTMPNNVFFGGKGPGVLKLKNVLLAFSRHNTQIGYCQGMNVIAAMLLLTHATEEDAFYVLVSIVENILPPYYFTPDLLASRADQRVLTRYVSELCPRIHNHFKKLSVDLEAVTFNWFLTVFTDCLSPEVLFRVFDLLFIEGNVYLFRVSIAIIKNIEKQILACTSPASVYSLLKNLSLEHFNIDSFIRETYENKKQIRTKDVMRLRDIEIRKLKLEIENSKLQEAVN